MKESIRKAITGQLRMHLEPQEYDAIENMLSEVYLLRTNGKEYYCLKPAPNMEDISMQFFAFNGAYAEIESWEYAKRTGKRII